MILYGPCSAVTLEIVVGAARNRCSRQKAKPSTAHLLKLQRSWEQSGKYGLKVSQIPRLLDSPDSFGGLCACFLAKERAGLGSNPTLGIGVIR